MMKDKKVKIISGVDAETVEKEIEKLCKEKDVIDIKQHSRYSAVIFYTEKEDGNNV